MVKAFVFCRTRKGHRPISGAMSFFEADDFDEFQPITVLACGFLSKRREKWRSSNKMLLFLSVFELQMKIAAALFVWTTAIFDFSPFSTQTTQDRPLLTEWDYPTP